MQQLSDLTTEQSEIVGTLFACWNDFIIDKKAITDQFIFDEVRNQWHLSKKHFSDDKLCEGMKWMRLNSIIPIGRKGHTLIKPKQ